MKRKDILQKNISRLVKTTSDSDRPSDEFTKTLIDESLAELTNRQTDRPKAERNRKMRIKWIRVASCAAVLMIVGIAAINLMLPLSKTGSLAKVEDKGNFTESPIPPNAIIFADKHEAYKPIHLEIETVKLLAERQNGPAVTVSLSATPRTLPELSHTTRFESIRGGTSSLGDDIAESQHIRKGYFTKLSLGLENDSTPPMAHGGNTPPNAEPYDAVFFKNYGVNPFVDTDDDHLSTFATDVDTGSYTVCRRYLLDGNLPPDEAVRVEEFVNYFDYGYAAPQEETFAVYTEAAPWSEWTGRKNSYLVRFGLKAMEVSDANRKPAILTFVIDVSGSMKRENRLGLVKKSLRMLVKRLRPKDKIGIAVYGSQGRKVLDHVNVKKKKKILNAIDSLEAGGSTFAEQGIRIGYEMADAAYKKGCINRVILCSDGVANVGRTGHEQILQVIKDKADKGITLSALGFGMGNYNDVLLERLGNKGNGYYAYIDTIDEAKRLFDGNLTGALQVVARDVKIQVDFNPEVVRSYRLIGYENRDVADNKFRDDKEDGGEMGAGHSATALYEIKLWQDKTGHVATTYIRYKDPDTRQVTEFNSTLATADFHESFDQASDAFALAATVTEFAEVLRKSYWAKDKTLDDVLRRTPRIREAFDADKDIAELINLISRAKNITPPPASDKHTDKNKDVFIAP